MFKCVPGGVNASQRCFSAGDGSSRSCAQHLARAFAPEAPGIGVSRTSFGGVAARLRFPNAPSALGCAAMPRPFDPVVAPPLAQQEGSTFPRLVELMQRLLAPDGCDELIAALGTGDDLEVALVQDAGDSFADEQAVVGDRYAQGRGLTLALAV